MRKTALFLSFMAPLSAAEPVELRPVNGKIEVLIGGQHVTSFHYGPKWDKPFLHPLKTPSGIVVSRGYPLEAIEGESNDHIWHRGLWYGGETAAADFWREKGPGQTGRLVVRGKPLLKGGSAHGSIAAVTDMVAPDGRRLGSIVQEFTFRPAASSYLIDAAITIRADQGMPVTMKDSEECCLAVRLKDEFREDRGATLLNSRGLSGSKAIWGKQAEWVDYSTTRQGRKVGVAIFDHPSNPRHPTYWHARGYGLNAANPFGVRDFTGDKSRDGSMTIAAGDKTTFRYRVVLHDGDAAEAGIRALFNAFAAEKP
jgi:hypothetical protein